MKTAPLLFFIFLFVSFSFHSSKKNNCLNKKWNPDAGLVLSFTKNAKVKTSSNQVDGRLLNDGGYSTAWQSDAPFPTGFLRNENQNLLKGKIKLSSSGKSEFLKAVDGDLETSARFIDGNKGNKITFGEVFLEESNSRLHLKYETQSPLELWFENKSGQSKKVASLLPEENYQLKVLDFSMISGESYVYLKSEGPFSIFEIGIPRSRIFESVVFEFEKIFPVGVLKTRHWAGVNTAISTSAHLSLDGIKWEKVAELSPDSEHPVLTALSKEIEAKYLKIEHELLQKDWNKVFIWEVDAYDRNGPFGEKPKAISGRTNLKEMLGVNGYWSWGTDICSKDLPKDGGPWRYAPVASHGRNYHDMTWDLKTPNGSIDFSKMKDEGTPAKGWVRWDDEYAEWVKAGLDVQASLQFYKYDEKIWLNPEANAYAYASSYVKHFGSTHGNGLVCTIEVGNEPWKYTSSTYREILKGMAKGAKETDPTMEVFPCALQAADPSADETDVFKNYIGTRITEEASKYLDGINIHSYSYVRTKNGKRIAVQPEHPQSTFWEILNAIRWRDENMPGKKIYLSEWGWDAAGGGEDCIHSECVSEKEGADYAIRGALIASRLGIDRATWFYYANTEGPSSLYTRSGLTGSKSTGFKKKRVFIAIKQLIDMMGESYFHSIVREDETAWVYQFSDKLGKPTHLVGWIPKSGEYKHEREVILPGKFQIISASKLDGKIELEMDEAFSIEQGKSSVILSTTPTVFTLN